VQKQQCPPSFNTTENLSTSFSNTITCKQAPPAPKSIMKNVDMENQANNSSLDVERSFPKPQELLPVLPIENEPGIFLFYYLDKLTYKYRFLDGKPTAAVRSAGNILDGVQWHQLIPFLRTQIFNQSTNSINQHENRETQGDGAIPTLNLHLITVIHENQHRQIIDFCRSIVHVG